MRLLLIVCMTLCMSACTIGTNKLSNSDTKKSSIGSVEGSLVPAKDWINQAPTPIVTGPVSKNPGILK